MTVKAVFCWSEYYNGKWQPTKTSDVNRPAYLGQFNPDPTEWHGFDRSKWLLYVDGGVDSQADMLQVWVAWKGNEWSYFVLQNTHSLPVHKEDCEKSDLYVATSPHYRWSLRTLDEYASILTATYVYPDPNNQEELPWTRNLIDVQNAMHWSVIEPSHDSRDSWDAPFLFSDSRHVFFVTTTEEPVPDLRLFGYGCLDRSGLEQVDADSAAGGSERSESSDSAQVVGRRWTDWTGRR